MKTRSGKKTPRSVTTRKQERKSPINKVSKRKINKSNLVVIARQLSSKSNLNKNHKKKSLKFKSSFKKK